MVKGISVFLPAYNDEKTIGKLILEAASVLDSLGIDYEIIVIDDCSKDATARVVGGIMESHERVRLVRHTENRDYGGVLKTGFASAAKEWVFYTDGDGQYDIKEIVKLLPYAQDYDLINGYIRKRMDSPCRMILGKIYQILIDTCFGKTLKYINCDFRLIKKAIIERITIGSDSGFAPAEMVIKIIRGGARVKEVAVAHLPRRYGHSQFLNLRKIVNLFRDLLVFLIRR